MRPTKLTPKVQQIICDHLAIGGTQAAACALARVSEVTVCEWKNRGKAALERQGKNEELIEEDRIYLNFLNAFNEAEAQAEQYFIGQIYAAVPTDPHHAWKWLERRRKEFMPIQRAEVSGPGGGPVETKQETYATISPDSLAAVFRILGEINANPGTPETDRPAAEPDISQSVHPA